MENGTNVAPPEDSAKSVDPSIEKPDVKGKYMDSFMWLGELDEEEMAKNSP